MFLRSRTSGKNIFPERLPPPPPLKKNNWPTGQHCGGRRFDPQGVAHYSDSGLLLSLILKVIQLPPEKLGVPPFGPWPLADPWSTTEGMDISSESGLRRRRPPVLDLVDDLAGAGGVPEGAQRLVVVDGRRGERRQHRCRGDRGRPGGRERGEPFTQTAVGAALQRPGCQLTIHWLLVEGG